jgi:predicted nucleic acid-binding protein
LKRVVVADTGPVHYLYLIDEIEILPTVFGEIHIPREVYSELCHAGAPTELRNWAISAPTWLRVEDVSAPTESAMLSLDVGERSAIALAESICADLLLMDDRKAVRAAIARGLGVTGTLGILRLAAEQARIDIRQAVERLRTTNFRYRQEMLDQLVTGSGGG